MPFHGDNAAQSVWDMNEMQSYLVASSPAGWRDRRWSQPLDGQQPAVPARSVAPPQLLSALP